MMRVIAWLVVLLVLSAPMPVAADGQADEAELQFQLGAEAYTAGDYRGALQHFLASNRLVPNRNVVFNIARVYEQLGRFPESYRYYVDALVGETDDLIIAEINQALKRLEPEVAIVDVVTTPPAATIYVDEKDLGSVGSSPRPIALPAGEYSIIVELVGYEPFVAGPLRLQLGKREKVEANLELIVGTIVITGDDGTEVRIDTAAGDPVCTIPCTLDAPPGSRTLFLTRSGRADTQRQVLVEANKSVDLEVRLEALTGSLLVQADEREALVEVDGRPSGFTPAIIPDVPIGKRKVRVSLSGYRPVELEVEVMQGEQTLVGDVRLVPLREVAAASRDTEAIEDAPASITIISRQELEAFAYPTIFEALRGVRGFSMTFDSIYGNANIRGLGLPNDYNNRMLILSDGASMNDNINAGASITYDNRSDLGDVDRIEIVRGPGSVVYGTGAVAGVVNVVPHGRDEPTKGEVSVGTADSGVARARITGNWRATPNAGARASLSASRSEGYDGFLLFDADGDGEDERNLATGIDDFEAYSTLGRGWLGPLTLQWHYASRRIRIPMGSFDSTFNDPRNFYEDTLGLVELRLETELSETVELLVRAHADTYRFHLDYFYELEDEDPDTGEIDIYEAPYFEDYLGFWFGGETRLTFRPTDNVRLALGGEVVVHPTVQIGASEADEVGGEETSLLDINPTYRVYAAYALFDWKPTSYLGLSLGTRLDAYDRDGAEDFVSVNPRAALILKPAPKHNIKLMGGRSFRAPSPYEFFYTDAGYTTLPSDCCGNVLRPETFYQSELEYTYRLDDDWSVISSGHGLLAQNFVGTLPVPEDEELVYFANTDDQLFAGAEVEVRREFRGGWMFAATGGFLEGRFLAQPSADGATTDNLRSPNAPRAYGSVKSVLPAIPTRLSLATRLTLEAPRRLSIISDEESEVAVIGDLVLTGRIEEYGVRYSLGVYNVFDWKLDLPVDPFPSLAMPQRPRSLLANVTLTL